MESGAFGEKNGVNYGGPDGTRNPIEFSEDEETSSSGGSELEEFDDCDCAEVESQKLDRIPYVTVYDNKEVVQQRGYFVPGYPVMATIAKAERDQSGRVHLINPYIYTIDLKHGHYQWTIKKRFVDFQRLHNTLSVYHATSKLTGGFIGRRRGTAGPSDVLLLRHTGGGDVVDVGQNETLEDVVEGIEKLKKQKTNDSIAIGESTAQYQKPSHGKEERVELRRFSAVQGHGLHEPERRGSVATTASSHQRQKRSQARHVKLPHFPILPDSVIGDDALEERKVQLQRYLSAVLHARPYREHKETAQFLEVGRLSFVHSLGHKYKEGLVKRRPGGTYSRSAVRNFCVTRCLNWRQSWLVVKDTFVTYVDPKAERIGDVVLFDRAFQVRTKEDKSQQTQGIRRGLHLSNMQRELLLKGYTEEDATAWKTDIEKILNVRQNVYGHWFVDGRPFMEHAANMMEIAKEEIFIADWWLNPTIYLKRPSRSERWRLDQILIRKAQEGVRVFILVYREIPQVLPLGSQHMEQYLQSLHPNIKVLRHPDHVKAAVVAFSHHEKLIVIDQNIAFVGGIDLCFGRWDDHLHKLTDLGGLEKCTLEEILSPHELEQLKKAYQEEPPSPAATDQAGEATTNFAFNGQSETEEGAAAAKKPVDLFQVLKEKQERMQLIVSDNIWKAKLKTLREKIKGENKELWLGKDYGNAYYKDLPEPEKAFDDFVDRSVIPRMPWHDISSVVYGSIARDVARHFIQRWNAAKADLAHDSQQFPLLLPKAYEQVGVPPLLRRMAIPCNVQVLRSSARWSAGLKETEASVQAAYIKIICEAKHYIYIENQFFVSHIAGTEVRNKIAQALYDRILRAHRNRETFRVYILMPLLPGFTKASGSMQMVLHWTCTSISKGARSLLHNLQKAIGDCSPYIAFYGLRNHAQLLGKLVTELIYIHSKLIIADDRRCLIGSANINDRSQLGQRDSEVAVVFDDTQFTPSTMNNQPYQAGTFAGSLRRRLFQEHLGLLKMEEAEEAQAHRVEVIDVTDPVSPEFFALWNDIAKRNTDIYDQVFKCAPSDELDTLEKWAKREAETRSMATADKEGSLRLLDGVRGHLVQFPLKFLSNSDLMKDRFVPESLMPAYGFN